MSALIITETQNRQGKHDGDEFKREATLLWEHWAIDHNIKDCTRLELGNDSRIRKFASVLGAISDTADLDRLALFGHGTTRNTSHGITPLNVSKFAEAVASVSNESVHIGLFCCLTGRGNFYNEIKSTQDRQEEIVTINEGIAMLLCSELFKLGTVATITAHLTSGHTTRNPYKVRIQPVDGKICRTRMKAPSPSIDWRRWVAMLKETPTYRFDTMFEDVQ